MSDAIIGFPTDSCFDANKAEGFPVAGEHDDVRCGHDSRCIFSEAEEPHVSGDP